MYQNKVYILYFTIERVNIVVIVVYLFFKLIKTDNNIRHG